MTAEPLLKALTRAGIGSRRRMADAIRQVVDDEYMPSAVVLHPGDVFKMAMAKDTVGNYVLPWLITMQNLMLAGIPLLMSTAITEGTFLVLSREAAQVFFRKEF